MWIEVGAKSVALGVGQAHMTLCGPGLEGSGSGASACRRSRYHRFRLAWPEGRLDALVKCRGELLNMVSVLFFLHMTFVTSSFTSLL